MSGRKSGPGNSRSAKYRRKMRKMMTYACEFPNDRHLLSFHENDDDQVPTRALAHELMEENIVTANMDIEDDGEAEEEVIEDDRDEGQVFDQQRKEEYIVGEDVVNENSEIEENAERFIAEEECNEVECAEYFDDRMEDVLDDCEVEDSGTGFLNNDPERLILPLIMKPHITGRDYLLAVIAISTRYRSTYECTLSLLKWLNSTLVDGDLPTTKKALWRALSRDDSCLTRHWYCTTCRAKLAEDEGCFAGECPCGACHTDGRQAAYFLQISLTSQLTELLSIPNIGEELQYRLTRRKQSVDAVEDLYDGAEYKKLCMPGQFLENLWNFSLTFNTDGASVASSSRASAWPVYVQLNELPPHARKKHMLLAGIWVDEQHPLVNVFLPPIVTELEQLYYNGITWKPRANVEIRSKFVTVIGTVDTIARAMIMRMNQFNGNFGCSMCYTEGHREPGCPGLKTYPVDTNSLLRTDAELRRHMEEATTMKTKVFGVQGMSCLTALPEFDLCNGIVVESMHNVYLGVTKHHTELLLSDAQSPWYIGSPNLVALIDQRLLSIKPPSRISRRPRTITCHKKWKASEWRNWVLYYCLPCLEGILPRLYFLHFAMLVQAIYTMNKKSFTAGELQNAERLLTGFVQRYQEYFGIECMTFNMHPLTHLSNTVRNWGPLWSHTAFPFEAWNYKILRTVTSPNARVDQIAIRFLMEKFIANIAYDDTASEEIKSLIHKLMGTVHYESNEMRLLKTFVGLGKKKTVAPSECHTAALANAGHRCTRLTLYPKANIQGCEYRCRTTNQWTKFCNSMISFGAYNFGEIIHIIEFSHEDNNVKGLLVDRYTSQNNAFGTTCIKRVEKMDNLVFVDIAEVNGPAMTVTISQSTYIIQLANCWESD